MTCTGSPGCSAQIFFDLKFGGLFSLRRRRNREPTDYYLGFSVGLFCVVLLVCLSLWCLSGSHLVAED